MKRLSVLCLLTSLACALPSPAQVAARANEGYRTKEGRASVAATLSAADRDARQRPQELVAGMGLKQGMTVVDLGTGVGYMLPFLSAAVGPGGKVLAEDIQTDFLDQAQAHAAQEKLGNVDFILGAEKDPKLPANTADSILVLDAYHHFDYPKQMLAHIGKALKPDGKLVIVEYYRRTGAMGPGDRAIQHIRLDQPDLIKEVEANGFRFVSAHDHVPNSQYMAIFGKK